MENNQDNVSINRTMSKPVKCVYYAIVLFGNVVVNKIPSRHIRKVQDILQASLAPFQ